MPKAKTPAKITKAPSAPRTTKAPAPKISKTFTPQFHENLDGRYGIAKEIRARVQRLREDTGAESAQRDLLVQRAAFLSVILESQECEAATTGILDVGQYVQATNAMIGLLKALGLDKRPKQADDLSAYLKEKRA